MDLAITSRFRLFKISTLVLFAVCIQTLSQSSLFGQHSQPVLSARETGVHKKIEAAIPMLGDPSASDWAKINALRNWVYRTVDLAASARTLLPFHDRLPAVGLERIFESLEADEGGLWCSGTAWVYAEILREFGFRNKILHYGVSPLLTHSVVLVNTSHEGNELITIQDPYFNAVYVDKLGRPMEFFRLLKLLRDQRGEEVRIESDAEEATKDVLLYFETLPYTAQRVARSGLSRFSPNPDCSPQGKNVFLCRLSPTLDAFLQAHYLVPDTLGFLEKQGLPRDTRYLFLFPFAVYDERGYIDDMADPFFKRAHETIHGSPERSRP